MIQANEEWKSIIGYEGLYEVSDCGNIKSLDRITNHPRSPNRRLKGRLLKVWCGPGHYPRITLTNGADEKSYCVHRLVALAFVPNPLEKRFVNHIDGNKKNAHKSNLEWVTHDENMHHAYITGLLNHATFFKGRKGEDNLNCKLTGVDVLMIRVLSKNGFSRTQIGKRFGVSSSQIGLIAANRVWKHLTSKELNYKP